MHIPANAILAIVLMALVSSCLRFATERYWVTVRIWGKLAASVVLLAGVAYLGHQGWRHATEYVWLKRAAGAPNFSPAQATCLKKAFAADPMNAETACAIGEAFRIQSSEGGDNYSQLAAAGDGMVRPQHQAEFLGGISPRSVGGIWLVPGLAGAS